MNHWFLHVIIACDLGEISNANVSWCLFVHLNDVNKTLCTLIESLVVVWVHSLLCWSRFDLSLPVRWQWWEINFTDFSVTLCVLLLLRWLCHFIRVWLYCALCLLKYLFKIVAFPKGNKEDMWLAYSIQTVVLLWFLIFSYISLTYKWRKAF